jgi:hypothetical protein
MAVRSQQVEARVLQLVDRVLSGGRIEDDRVECKGAWPTDHRKAARQIGGLANAAAGEPIMWIVGLDEDSNRLVDPGTVEPSEWWGKVQKVFAELAPEVEWLQVPIVGSQGVTALLFATSRAPYVVQTDGRSGVHREIPWRAAGATRSAHRSEILRSLVGEVQVPRIEPISAYTRVTFKATKRDGSVAAELEVDVESEAYIEASDTVTFPEHLWDLRLLVGDQVIPLDGTVAGPQEYLGPGHGPLGRFTGRYGSIGSIVSIPNSGLLVSGSDRISLSLAARFETDDRELLHALKNGKRIEVHGDFPIALSSRTARLRQALIRVARREMKARTVSASVPYLDTRLGEFTSDGSQYPTSYEGEHASGVVGYKKPQSDTDPRLQLGR